MDSSLSFARVTEDYLDETAALCNAYVGEDLYSCTYLNSVIDDTTHYFYLLAAPEKELAGDICFFQTDIDSISVYSKLPHEKLAVMSDCENPIIRNLQSIGVMEHYRSHQLLEEPVRIYPEQLQTQSDADAVFGLVWQFGGHIPVEMALKTFKFIYLTDARHVWSYKKYLPRRSNL